MRMHLLSAALIAGLATTLTTPLPAESLVIHEWGTFTSFQDENGRAIGGINIDDEPVPAFVHDAAPNSLRQLSDRFADPLQKGWPAADQRVTMRLETPVLYVHPADSTALKLAVRVEFRGGWLTQYFPDAIATIPGHRDPLGHHVFAPLGADSVGSLHWPRVEIGGRQVAPPDTTAPVWLAPRQVQAAPLTVGNEGERFLFYRGIGHLDAPVRVMRDSAGTMTIHAQPEANTIQAYWLVDIRADGQLAYRQIDRGGSQGPYAAGMDHFDDDAYGPQPRAALRAHLHAAVVAEGRIFADEADALLNTWDASYFRSPGLRVFFLAPRSWTERVLTLTISQPAQIERAMIGRIELISPKQRAQLAIISAGPTSQPKWWRDFLSRRVYEITAEGKTVFRPQGQELLRQASSEPGAFTRLGLAVPADYQAYLALGRFREALIARTLADHPTPGLVAFAKTYGLRKAR